MLQYTALNRNKLRLLGTVILTFWLWNILIKTSLRVNMFYVYRMLSTTWRRKSLCVFAIITILLVIISNIGSRKSPRLHWKTHTLNLSWSLTSPEMGLDSWSLTRQNLDNILCKAIEFLHQSLWIYLFPAKAFNLLC